MKTAEGFIHEVSRATGIPIDGTGSVRLEGVVEVRPSFGMDLVRLPSFRDAESDGRKTVVVNGHPKGTMKVDLREDGSQKLYDAMVHAEETKSGDITTRRSETGRVSCTRGPHGGHCEFNQIFGFDFAVP